MKVGINKADFATYLLGLAILGILLCLGSFIGITIIRIVGLHQADSFIKILDFEKGWFYVWNIFMVSLIVFSRFIKNDSNWFAKNYSQYGILYIFSIAAIITGLIGWYISNKPNLF